MSATFDSRRRVLTFPSLFPGVDSATAAQLKSMVASRTHRDQPDHKRLDARRARLTGTVRKGDFSLSIEIRGRNHQYAVTKALNLINELFLSLHEGHPEYLVERFGISTSDRHCGHHDTADLSAGNGRSLTAKLDAAAAQLAKGQANPAMNQLGAFINETNALIHSGRLPASGNALSDLAQRIIQSMSL